MPAQSRLPHTPCGWRAGCPAAQWGAGHHRWWAWGNILLEVFIQLYRAQTHRLHLDARQTLCAGLSGLLLIGYSGFFLFLLLESFQPGSFRGPDPGGVSLQDLFYFSYISLMTIGYGDITPVSWAARNATVLVSLSANIYSLVVIASIVGRTFASRPVQKADKEPAPKENP